MQSDQPHQQLQPIKKDFSKNIGSNSNSIESCAHNIIMKDMCCICGKNLRPKGGFSGERIEQTTANVSMIHHVPELVVSKEIADELGARDHENILRQRKLILLMDLDQTLIHTSNRPLRPEEVGATNLIAYRLGGCTFYTKMRPHVQTLLEHLNSLYEMHIVTFGQRLYAHKIAELLDPDRKYFAYRILSRDELLSSMHKTGNLKALFPCSEQLILMLDDRPDVWMHSEALIRVKPYRFFKEVGDINAPPQEFLDLPTETVIPPPPIQNLEIEESGNQTEKEPQQLPNKEQQIMENERKEKEEIAKEEQLSNENNKTSRANSVLTEPIAPLSDDDNVLEHTERVLVKIHSLFYQQYNLDKKLPDVKSIIRRLRSQVLSGERIVFSGIIPLGVDVRACEIYRLCTQFGAKVDDGIVQRRTTVLVAVRAATEKYRLARRFGIPIVTTRWLDTCFERWQRVDKRDFLFREDEEQLASAEGSKSNRYAGGTGAKRQFSIKETKDELSGSGDAEPVKRHRLSSISLCLDEEMDHFAQMDTLSTKALHEMEDEVENALSEDDENEENDSDGKSSTSSADYSGIDNNDRDDEFPASSKTNKTKKAESAADCTEDYLGEEYAMNDLDEDNKSKEFIDYGDEDTTRDAELDEEEDDLYDELADDLEVQLKDVNRTNHSGKKTMGNVKESEGYDHEIG